MKSKSPFKMRDYDGKEIFSDKVTRREPIKLVTALLALAVIYGIDRIETVINNTYAPSEASKIVEMMNFVTKNTA
jgi:hypothetical protein